MSVSTALIKAGNKLFKKQLHPFNMQNDGQMSYAQWQYEKGAQTIQFYTEQYSFEEMFRDKRVLDMGCGAAGKSLYYVSLGARHVTGVDIVAHYRCEAEAFAAELGFADRFSFVCASAFELPFPDGSFDTIIMNDFMEHVSQPELALKEALRLIAPGGRIFVNFPPYYHPVGAHMSDAINMPWVHLFFSDKALIRAYSELVAGEPDCAERLALRFSRDENGKTYISYINKMTIRRFRAILNDLEITPLYYRETPLRSFLKPLAKFPPTRELFVKMVACVIGKAEQPGDA